ncbi:hypothetical protein NADFUDRAFT_82171, partial [Nadsonia fulvescens var. elongata DSM 6958]
MAIQIHIRIKVQLAILMSMAVLLGLGVLSLVTYFDNRNTVLRLRGERLTVTARLKSSQITQSVRGVTQEIFVISSKDFIQNTAKIYNSNSTIPGNISAQIRNSIAANDNFLSYHIFNTDLEPITTVYNNYSQISSNIDYRNDILLPRNGFDSPSNATILKQAGGTFSEIVLLDNPDGSQNLLVGITVAIYNQQEEENNKKIYQLSLHSLSSDNSDDDILGFFTVVCTIDSLSSILNDPISADDTTLRALISLTPESYVKYAAILLDNNLRLAADPAATVTPLPLDTFEYTYVTPVKTCDDCFGKSFKLLDNPVAVKVLINRTNGYVLQPERYTGLALGYAPTTTLFRRWGMLVGQGHQVTYQPLRDLRNISLISLFTIGLGVCVMTILLTNFAADPINRLQRATEFSTKKLRRKDDIDDYTAKNKWYNPHTWYRLCFGTSHNFPNEDPDNQSSLATVGDGLAFIIPKKVVTKPRFFRDELTELTETFNQMTHELRKQYDNLDKRVKQRTMAIEAAKIIAESANEAKSLFIANITNELRTPLNSILGLAAASMSENDISKIKQSLKIICKSGELLLHLLTDLLTFSKNQFGKMELDYEHFLLDEVISQIKSIFSAQCRESQIDFRFVILSPALNDYILCGDFNRLIQMIIKLISNSFRSTRQNGEIKLYISIEDGSSDHTISTNGFIQRNSDHVHQKSNSIYDLNTPPEKERLDQFPVKGFTLPDKFKYRSKQGSIRKNTTRVHSLNRNHPDISSSSELSNIYGSTNRSLASSLHSDLNGLSIRFQIVDSGARVSTKTHTNGSDPFVIIKDGDINSEASGSLNPTNTSKDNERENENNNKGNNNNKGDDKSDKMLEKLNVPAELKTEKLGQENEQKHEKNGELKDNDNNRIVIKKDNSDYNSAGVGLGLSICKQLASIMHGSVSMELDAENGSNYVFLVPLGVVGKSTDVNRSESRHRSNKSSESHMDSILNLSFNNNSDSVSVIASSHTVGSITEKDDESSPSINGSGNENGHDNGNMLSKNSTRRQSRGKGSKTISKPSVVKHQMTSPLSLGSIVRTDSSQTLQTRMPDFKATPAPMTEKIPTINVRNALGETVDKSGTSSFNSATGVTPTKISATVATPTASASTTATTGVNANA